MEVGLVQLLWESLKLGSTAHPLYATLLGFSTDNKHNGALTHHCVNRLNNRLQRNPDLQQAIRGGLQTPRMVIWGNQ